MKKTENARSAKGNKTAHVAHAVRELQGAPLTERTMRLLKTEVASGQLTPEVIREYLADSALSHVSTPSGRMDAFDRLLRQFGIGDTNPDEATLTFVIEQPK